MLSSCCRCSCWHDCRRGRGAFIAALRLAADDDGDDLGSGAFALGAAGDASLGFVSGRGVADGEVALSAAKLMAQQLRLAAADDADGGDWFRPLSHEGCGADARSMDLSRAADLLSAAVPELGRLSFWRSSCASPPKTAMPTMNLLLATKVRR